MAGSDRALQEVERRQENWRFDFVGVGDLLWARLVVACGAGPWNVACSDAKVGDRWMKTYERSWTCAWR